MSPFVGIEEKEDEEMDTFDELALRLNLKFDHSKPADASMMGSGPKEKEEEMANSVHFNVADKIKELAAEQTICKRAQKWMDSTI